ncbi:MAG: hypothetical protein ACOC80_09220 [Petrotogales bacterium]
MKTDKDEDEYKPSTFSQEDAEEWFEQGKHTSSSAICAAVYGWDGTGKTGACLDCRSGEEIEQGKKVVIFDLDGSAGPLKKKYFDDDENIIIFDPLTLDDRGEIDYVSMFNKILTFAKFLYKNERKLNLKAVILDGLNKLLKTAEHVMRYEDLKVNPDARITDQWQWSRRNRRYYTVLELLKKLNCDRFFITHYKEKREYQSGELKTVGKDIDWHRQTSGVMFQKIRMSRQEVDDIVEFNAKVEKAKGALHLEGKEYKVAEVKGDETAWYGLNVNLWEKLRETNPKK